MSFPSMKLYRSEHVDALHIGPGYPSFRAFVGVKGVLAYLLKTLL